MRKSKSDKEKVERRGESQEDLSLRRQVEVLLGVVRGAAGRGRVPPDFLTDDEGDLEGIDLQQHLRTLWHRKWVILGLALLTAILAYLGASVLTPQYRATAKLLIENRQLNLVPTFEVWDIEGKRRDEINNHIMLMNLREVAEQFVGEMGLDGLPRFAAPPEPPAWKRWLPDWLLDEETGTSDEALTPEGRKWAAVDFFQEGLEIEPDETGRIILISFKTTDPELTARIVNRFAEFYLDYDRDSRLKATQSASGWVFERLGRLRQELETSEKALQAYREEANIVSRGPEPEKGVAGLVADLAEAKLVREQAARLREEAESASLEETGPRIPPTVSRHSLVQPVLQAYEEASRNVALLSERYGPKHPKMKQAQAAFDLARRALGDAIADAKRAIGNDYRVAVAREEALSGELAQSRTGLVDLERKEYRLQSLEREVATNREFYNLFLERSKESGIIGDLQTAIGRVVEQAELPEHPHSPNKSRIVKVALLLGVVLGIGLALLLEYLDRTFKGTEDVERRLRLSVLGILPLLKLKKGDRNEALQLFTSDPKGGFAEAIRTIRTGVMLSGLDDPHKVIVVTSSVPGEGKTTLASNLAMALGQMERVLLIDADMRRPMIGEAFGHAPDQPGLSALVAGTAEEGECISETGHANLWLLPCGVVPPNPLELLSSQRFADLVARLAEQYDRVVIDSAPCQVVSDALMLSRRASAVIYVVKADATPFHVAQRGIKRLQEFGAPLLGVVLNHVDTAKATRYYGKYGYYRHDYQPGYGYDQQ